MNGYVRNKGLSWRHAMKRSIGPGHKISLDELYEQYGEKHGLEEGTPFVEWLRSIKLTDNSVWEIVYEDNTKNLEVDKATKERQMAEMVVPMVKKELEVADIVNMSVRTARVDLKKITDIKLLKYALTEANQLQHKDSLVRMLRKRIKDLEITRR
jgi:hypothetical protein